MPELGPLYRVLEQSVGEIGVARSIELHLDELVNATDTATYLAGLKEVAGVPGHPESV